MANNINLLAQSETGLAASASQVSIIIPVINEFDNLSTLLPNLKKTIQKLNASVEIITIDGGSSDGSDELSAQYADKSIQSPKGRAIQQNAGAACASGAHLWFLHADSTLDFAQLSAYLAHIRAHSWGWFSLRVDDRKPVFAIMSWLINRRSRLSQIATGDQGVFVKRELFERIGGFPDQLLMEDIELCKRLKSRKTNKLIRANMSDLEIITSARKWQKEGVFKTMRLMWRLRLLYFLGVDAGRLHRSYYQ